MYSLSVMTTIMHVSCICANRFVHESFKTPDSALATIDTAMDIKEESGRRIRERREDCRLSVTEAAEQLEFSSPSRLVNYEKGRRMVSVEDAKRMADLFKNCSAAYLLTLEEKLPDPRLQKLAEIYEQTDERGKTNIIRAAESESAYFVDHQTETTTKAA